MSWKEISGDTIIETGETYKTHATLHRTSGNSSDAYVIYALENAWSYTDLNDLLIDTYGTDVTVKRVSAKKVDINLFEQTIEFKCTSANTPVLAVLLAKVIIVVVIPGIVAWLLMDKFEHLVDLDAFDIKTPSGVANLFPIVIIVIAIIAMLILIKS